MKLFSIANSGLSLCELPQKQHVGEERDSKQFKVLMGTHDLSLYILNLLKKQT